MLTGWAAETGADCRILPTLTIRRGTPAVEPIVAADLPEDSNDLVTSPSTRAAVEVATTADSEFAMKGILVTTSSGVATNPTKTWTALSRAALSVMEKETARLHDLEAETIRLPAPPTVAETAATSTEATTAIPTGGPGTGVVPPEAGAIGVGGTGAALAITRV